jgi:hypothetical protein
MSVWDDPALKVGGEFVQFKNVGDSISGVIQVIRPHRFENGDVAPEILLVADTGEERTLTAGQIRLKTELAAQRPEAGDWIRVTLTQIEPRAGGKELKHFAVEVRRGNGQVPAVAAAPVQQYPPQQYAPPAPAQPYGVPQVPAGYQAPPLPAAPTVPQQAYVPPTPPPVAPTPPAPAAPPAAAAAANLTPEQQAAINALPPEARAALGL